MFHVLVTFFYFYGMGDLDQAIGPPFFARMFERSKCVPKHQTHTVTQHERAKNDATFMKTVFNHNYKSPGWRLSLYLTNYGSHYCWCANNAKQRLIFREVIDVHLHALTRTLWEEGGQGWEVDRFTMIIHN